MTRPVLSGAVDRFWSLARDVERSADGRLEAADLGARTLVRAYYLGLLLLAVQHLALWDQYVRLRAIRPLWPVFWAKAENGRDAMIVLLLFAFGAFVAALFPDRTAARAAACLGALEFYAFVSSFGNVRHIHHLTVLTSFLFVFLPGRGAGRARDDEERRAFLRGVWGVQCGLLLTYSMSGGLKLLTGIWHLLTGQGGVLTPPAMALHVANTAFRFGLDPPLADLAVRALPLGLPVYLAVIGFELLSLPIAFRPRLHRPWGAVLVLMHLGIGLTLNLFFLSSVFISGLLLLASPFEPDAPDWRRAAWDVPLLGRLARRLLPGRAAP